jgi:hypothetical protein
MRFGELTHLETDELQALLLDAADHFTGEAALDAVGFQQDESAFEHDVPRAFERP